MSLNRRCVYLTFAFVLLAGAAAARPPFAIGETCRPIDSLPAVISEPGSHCLTSDFAVDLQGGAAITVEADHVTVDLGGHTIENRDTTGIALGVYSWERSHVVVRNGTLVGFFEAVGLSGPFGTNLSRNHLVEGLRVIASGRTAIGIVGSDSIVRGNTIFGVGDGVTPKEARSGLFLGGWRHRAIDNDIFRVVGGFGLDVGIRFLDGGSHMAFGNRISSAEAAILFPSAHAGQYRDNVANEALLPAFHGGLDLGGNSGH